MPRHHQQNQCHKVETLIMQMPDSPLSDVSHDNEKYFIPLHKYTKKNSLCESMSSCDHLPSPPSSTVSEQSKFKRKIRVDLGLGPEKENKSSKSSFCSSFHDSDGNISTTKTLSVTKEFKSHCESHQQGQFWKKDNAASTNRLYNNSHRKINFDICFRGIRNSGLTGATPLEKNKDSCIEFEMQDGGTNKETNDVILRPGMVLLKHHLTHEEQVEIVKKCRDLGLGPGGFYQPGYGDGAKFRLKMMCLGMDWDPQTRKYGYKREIDGSKPPSIPHYFSKLVIRSIQEARNLINQESVEHILPSITPDICIVNFYLTNGRLGLHQDRDESRESLQKGLPVVSFSIGDSAEFLYSDQRNVEKAENVLLESGDVLIFGGESRHVYHGVSSIIQNSAPDELVQDTCLCPGRLNLTFRQY
ncbi:uncharacterized protein [Medicago truncatula]|uniref:uncharacterized protein isoform X2 n=1 Tax=Medicago truncatula TaxID=3880 RepID=UPI000D2F2624|nr:uncharacterized protein LOC11425593 isoform X2 [Medicago truncatula]